MFSFVSKVMHSAMLHCSSMQPDIRPDPTGMYNQDAGVA